MFQKIRYQLLLSYLLVLATILGVFTFVVRIAFYRSLTNQLTKTLTFIGQSAIVNAHYDKNFKDVKIQIDRKFPEKDFLAADQALQWFNPQGDLVAQQGKGNAFLTLPFSANEPVQSQEEKVQGVTLPIIVNNDRKLIGYVRVSQSLEDIDQSLNKLDWGLGGGICIALLLSGVSGILLTRQAMKPIEEGFQRFKQFTTDASHELRSPLMAIKINATVALKYIEGMRETDVKKFQSIASATNQMIRLTEDLLFLARYDKIPTQNWDTVNLTVILDNLLQLYKLQAEAKQINLQSELIQNLYLLGDSVQLTRLFTNLIENAINYTSNEGLVEIKASQIGSQIYVKVRDTGVGIALENIDKVFDRFWRAEQSRSYHLGGSGLGLAIAQAIAESHGGLITVTSQLNVGSCFTVRLSASTAPLELKIKT
ncbi:MAG: HAMP domain-containing sensor histidine kinase [Rhizonema sp. NSF051]|nr:HAMP domain-containing sensor histidine kinase [Rhizonema sp. NSF051]